MKQQTKQLHPRNFPLLYAIPVPNVAKPSIEKSKVKSKLIGLFMFTFIFTVVMTGLHYFAFQDVSQLRYVLLLSLGASTFANVMTFLRNLITRYFGIFVAFGFSGITLDHPGEKELRRFGLKDGTKVFWYSIFIILGLGLLYFTFLADS